MIEWRHTINAGTSGCFRSRRLRHLPLSCALIAVATVSVCSADSNPHWTEWSRTSTVRNQTDTIHLDWRQLQTWQAVKLELPAVRKFLKEEYKPLWVAALSSGDRELRRNALLSIGQAHQEEFLDFSDVTQAVQSTFRLDDLRPETRTDAARTLIILDARSSAPDLMTHLEDSSQLRHLAERAFAEWDYKPARAMWMERLARPDTCPPSQITLALRGLGHVRHPAAAGLIRDLTLSPTASAPLRLTAARALADLQNEGLEETAQLLLSQADTSNPVSGLLAGTVLQRHRSPASQDVLLKLLNSSSSAAAALAWQRLNAVKPERIPASDLQNALQSRDTRLRLLAVQNCGLRADLPVDSLLAALNDHHPDIRCQARHILKTRSLQADTETVSEDSARIQSGLTAAFQANSWRGLEQACLLAAELNHSPSAITLVDLLKHERNEVAASAANALKQLSNPAVLPQMLAHAVSLDERMATDRPRVFRRAEWVLPHLFESFAEQNYQPAETLQRKYVSKTPFRYGFSFCRMAAIWSLAHLHEGSPDADLVRQFTQRMFDQSIEDPESEPVITACALALGIMQSEPSVGDLRRLTGLFDQGMPPWQAAFWSLHRMTGEAVPPPRPGGIISRSDWFLNPLSSSRTKQQQ